MMVSMPVLRASCSSMGRASSKDRARMASVTLSAASGDSCAPSGP